MKQKQAGTGTFCVSENNFAKGDEVFLPQSVKSDAVECLEMFLKTHKNLQCY